MKLQLFALPFATGTTITITCWGPSHSIKFLLLPTQHPQILFKPDLFAHSNSWSLYIFVSDTALQKCCWECRAVCAGLCWVAWDLRHGSLMPGQSCVDWVFFGFPNAKPAFKVRMCLLQSISTLDVYFPAICLRSHFFEFQSTSKALRTLARAARLTNTLRDDKTDFPLVEAMSKPACSGIHREQRWCVSSCSKTLAEPSSIVFQSNEWNYAWIKETVRPRLAKVGKEWLWELQFYKSVNPLTRVSCCAMYQSTVEICGCPNSEVPL